MAEWHLLKGHSTANPPLTRHSRNQEESKQKESKERKGFGFAAEGGNIKSSLFPSFPSVQIPNPDRDAILSSRKGLKSGIKRMVL